MAFRPYAFDNEFAMPIEIQTLCNNHAQDTAAPRALVCLLPSTLSFLISASLVLLSCTHMLVSVDLYIFLNEPSGYTYLQGRLRGASYGKPYTKLVFLRFLFNKSVWINVCVCHMLRCGACIVCGRLSSVGRKACWWCPFPVSMYAYMFRICCLWESGMNCCRSLNV